MRCRMEKITYFFGNLVYNINYLICLRPIMTAA